MGPPWLLPPLETLPSTDVLVSLGGLLLIAVVVVVGIWVKFSVLHAATSGGGSDEPRLNCPDCGARNLASRERCTYCEEPLPAETERPN